MARISELIVGLILVSVIVIGFILFMADLNNTYGVPSTFDNETLQSYNKLNEIAAFSMEIKNQTEDVQQKSGALDVLGDFFSAGFKVLRLTGKSVDTVSTVIDEGTQDVELGAFGVTLKSALIAITIIILFLGILVSALVKWNI